MSQAFISPLCAIMSAHITGTIWTIECQLRLLLFNISTSSYLLFPEALQEVLESLGIQRPNGLGEIPAAHSSDSLKHGLD